MIRDFSITCPFCENNVNRFKDEDSHGETSEIDFFEADAFSDVCLRCGAHVSFKVKEVALTTKPRRKLTIKDYNIALDLDIKNESARQIELDGGEFLSRWKVTHPRVYRYHFECPTCGCGLVNSDSAVNLGDVFWCSNCNTSFQYLCYVRSEDKVKLVKV